MTEVRRNVLRFAVLAVAGYLSLATSAPAIWTVESAYVDIPLTGDSTTVRIRVHLESEDVALSAPELARVSSSSGRTWVPGDGSDSDQYCDPSSYIGRFCEAVPLGSATLEYELSLIRGTDSVARIEVLAGGYIDRLERPNGRFGLSVEVLP